MQLPLPSAGCIVSKAPPESQPSDSRVRDTLLHVPRSIAAEPASVATPYVLLAFLDFHLVEIRHLRMASLDASQTTFHLEAVFQLTFGNPLLQPTKSSFDLVHKTATNSLLFLLTPRRATQNVSLFPAR